jgi:hypothetical protein
MMSKYKDKAERLQQIIRHQVNENAYIAGDFCKHCSHADKDGYAIDYDKYCGDCQFELRSKEN